MALAPLLYSTCGTEIVFGISINGVDIAFKDEAAVRHVNECANWSGWQEVVPHTTPSGGGTGSGTGTPAFDASQIDPATVAQLFGAGFLLYLTPWAAAWSCAQMLKMIRLR